MELNSNDRYSRQFRLLEVGPAGQEKLNLARVLVVGAGGLGCPVLLYLTGAGVGNIGIVDNDIVSLQNLHRQILYSERDIDQPKAVAAKKRLEHLNSGTRIETYFEKLSAGNALKIMAGYDFIVDCTDTFATRYLINDAAVILDKPVVYGAVQRFEGQVTVFNFRGGPTLRCLMPDPPHPLEVPSCEETGVMGPVAGIIGALQATEAIKVILDADSVLSGQIFVVDAFSLETQLIPLKRNPETAVVSTLKEDYSACLSDDSTTRKINREELDNILTGETPALVIDLRDPEETSDPGFPCLRIPLSDLVRQIDRIPADRPVVFYCRYGIKSVMAVNYLQSRHKYSNLFWFDPA